jgi:hypothetical protein
MERLSIPNLLIVSGNGRKSGKTFMACTTIKQASRENTVIGIKISSHFHEPGDSLKEESLGEGYKIFEELSADTGKDTARMKKSGAKKVFYIQAAKEKAYEAFMRVYGEIPPGCPIVCEAQSLAESVNPGLFFLMSADGNELRKDVSRLRQYTPVELLLRNIVTVKRLPVAFRYGKWIFEKC